jgi:hypothetical protein
MDIPPSLRTKYEQETCRREAGATELSHARPLRKQ